MGPDRDVPETPAVPAELKEGLPRRLCLTGNGIKTVITAGILFLLAAYGAFETGTHFLRFSQQETALRRSGSEMTAQIKRVWVPGGSSVTWVSYAFAVNGAKFKG